jgi:putative membrane protein
LCVKYGWIFGQYHYNAPFFFGLVPFTIPFLWAVVIYTSYTITNLFLFGFGGEKPKRKDNLWYFVGLLVLISSISGLIAVNLDMMVEPITASSPVPDWVWLLGGPYFGVPISNFIGWFSVTLVAIFIFRFYEAFSSSSEDFGTLNIPLNLYILIVYLFYFLNNAFKAFTLGKTEYILIGVTTMTPFILIGLLALVVNWKGCNNKF